MDSFLLNRRRFVFSVFPKKFTFLACPFPPSCLCLYLSQKNEPRPSSRSKLYAAIHLHHISAWHSYVKSTKKYFLNGISFFSFMMKTRFEVYVTSSAAVYSWNTLVDSRKCCKRSHLLKLAKVIGHIYWT